MSFRKEGSSFLKKTLNFSLPLTSSKVLTFGNTQINLVFLSLNRTFAVD